MTSIRHLQLLSSSIGPLSMVEVDGKKSSFSQAAMSPKVSKLVQMKKELQRENSIGSRERQAVYGVTPPPSQP